MTATSRITRSTVSVFVSIALMFGLMSAAADDASAQVLIIGATVGDTASVDCTYQPGQSGTAQLNARFSGPLGQWVYHRTLIWEVVNNNFELAYIDADWTTVQIATSSQGLNAAPYTDMSRSFTLPGGSELRSWLVEVETWRWTSAAGFTNYNREIAGAATVYGGQLYPGFCFS